MKTTEWVLLDTETSGLGHPIYCIEIAAQRMVGTCPDGMPFRALLNHDVDIEPQAESLHGYSRRFLRANGRSPAAVHHDFNAYADSRPVVAYNLSFDWARVLEPELGRLSIIPAYEPGFCALTLARRCIHETDGHKLDTLRHHFFPDHAPVTHRALDDLEVTTKLFVEIIWPRLARAGLESFSDVANFSRNTPVSKCLDRIRNPQSSRPPAAPVVLDLESQLVGTIKGMLADNQIVDAEVWALKHWLDTNAQHRSDLAVRSRTMLSAALADGGLASWEFDELRTQLMRLLGYRDQGLQSGAPSGVKRRSSPTIDGVEKKRRLSLTKRQLEEEIGASLLDLLSKIVGDGDLSDGDIVELSKWLLENQSADLPAVGYLLDVVKDILADGKITDSERLDLFLGIEKVLPVTQRRTVKAAREEADIATREQSPRIGREELRAMAAPDEQIRFARRSGWRSDPMTSAQSAFVRSLGGTIGIDATKGEASDLIETLLGDKPITSRQQMVMRFWDRDEQPHEGPREISEWMDQFYREDSDRKLAWELFKNESEDNGLQGDASRVPLGVGPTYLARIKAGGEAAIPRFRADAPTFGSAANSSPNKKSGIKFVAIVGIAAALIFAAVWLSLRTEEPTTSPEGPTTPLTVAPANPQVPSSVQPARTSLAQVPSSSSTQSAPIASAVPANENQTIVRGLRVSGFIAGARPRVLIGGKLVGVGDVVDATRGILVHSINVETRTVTFLDLAGEVHSRSIN